MNMSRPIVRIVSTMTLICMSIALFFGCATVQNSSNPVTSSSTPASSAPTESEASAAPTAPAEKTPVTLEMSVFWQWGSPFTQPENDIVGKAIQEHSKYTIKLKDVFYEKNGNWTEEYNLFAAANNFPDVCQFPSSGIDTVAKFSDYFYDLKDYITDIAKTPNLHKYHTPEMIANNQKYKTQDGKYLGWPVDVTPDFSDASIQSQYSVWYHNAKSNGVASSVLAREDILKQLGYTFTPVKDLIAKVESTNSYLTQDDLKLNPPIDTIQQMEDLFTKAQALNLKAKDGSPVVTLSGGSGGLTFWFGGVFAFDFFRKLPDGTITAYYGGPYAKDYYKTLNGWYRKGIVDKDMFLAKADQITAKISNGGAAFWMSMGAADTQIQDSLLKLSPDAWVRPIPLPQYKADLPPYVQTTQPGPGQSLAINKNFKQLDDLIGYLDYLYSDEGQDLVMWGDGEGTVWKIQDGKKVFIDDAMYKAVLDGSGTLTDSNGKSAKTYGLTFYSPYTVVFNKNWLMNPYHYSYSYPNKLIGWNEVCRAAGENTIDVSGKWSNPIPRGELAAKANNFFWAQSWDPSAKMILSDDDATFEKNWTDVYTAFMKEVGDYKKMQEEMAVTFTP